MKLDFVYFTRRSAPTWTRSRRENRTTKNEKLWNVETEKEWKKDETAQETRYYIMGVYIIVRKERKPA